MGRRRGINVEMRAWQCGSAYVGSLGPLGSLETSTCFWIERRLQPGDIEQYITFSKLANTQQPVILSRQDGTDLAMTRLGRCSGLTAPTGCTELSRYPDAA